MTTRAELIAAAVKTALTSPAMTSVPAASVFRDLRGALQAEVLPAVVVVTGNEPPPVRSNFGQKTRTVEIRVSVLAAGSTGHAAADPGHVEVFNRLFADPTLGGLAHDLDEGPILRERDDAERQRVAVTHTFLYRYRTADASIE